MRGAQEREGARRGRPAALGRRQGGLGQGRGAAGSATPRQAHGTDATLDTSPFTYLHQTIYTIYYTNFTSLYILTRYNLYARIVSDIMYRFNQIYSTNKTQYQMSLKRPFNIRLYSIYLISFDMKRCILKFQSFHTLQNPSHVNFCRKTFYCSRFVFIKYFQIKCNNFLVLLYKHYFSFTSLF